jgi:hypothetical protein
MPLELTVVSEPSSLTLVAIIAMGMAPFFRLRQRRVSPREKSGALLADGIRAPRVAAVLF